MLQRLAKFIGLFALLLVLALPSLAQNTKGDAPQSKRETRFRKSDKKFKLFGRNKKKGENTRVARQRAVYPRSAHKPVRSPNGKTPTYSRSASGGSLRVSTRPKRNQNLYPQHGRFVNNPSKEPRKTERVVSNKSIAGRSRVPTSSRVYSRNHNVYPQRGRFVNNPSQVPRSSERAVSNRSTLSRLSGLQSPRSKPPRDRRIKARTASRSFSPNKTINIQARFPRPKRKTERAFTRDIAGRRLRTKNYRSPKTEIVQNQSAKRFSRTAKDKARRTPTVEFGRFRNFSSVQAKTFSGRKPRIQPRSVSGRASRGWQSRRFISNPEVLPRSTERVYSNRSAQQRLKRLQGPDPKPTRKAKVKPRSGSRSYVSNKTINMWARFPRPKKKREQAVTTDIAGRPLRTRNYRSPKNEIIEPGFQPYYRRKRVGDRAYRGPAAGTHSSATRGPRAWIGDIAKRAIRGIKKPKHDTASEIPPGGYRSATRHGETRPGNKPLPVRQPGFGAELLRHATGKVTGRRSLRGGGSVSGRAWNNKGNALQVRPPGAGSARAGLFQGNIKTRRAQKGGGSISGSWNNRNRAIPGRTPGANALRVDGFPGKMRRFEDGQPGFGDQGEEFTGFIKARKPLKGGGSVSGKTWNNKRTPVPVKGPGVGSKGMNYAGFTKTRRAPKGGGSVSGKLWNNNRTPVPVRTPGQGADGMRGFAGNIKAKRPAKGGGSISGSWNNNNRPLDPRLPGSEAFSMRGYSGNIKARRPDKGGGSISGKLWNNKETPLTPRAPGNEAFAMRGYSGNIKARRPEKGGGSVSGKLWNNKETPIQVRLPGEQGMGAGNYTGNLKLSRFKRDYIKNPNSSALASKKSRPEKSVFQEGELQVKVKKYNYVKNKNVDEDANKVREPGRSFGKAADFQGNIKMTKFQLFEKSDLHPDAKFIRTNKNNTDEERDMVTNFKLWWARLFRKGETQPDHLKDKGRKPRYDKGEAGMWYE